MEPGKPFLRGPTVLLLLQPHSGIRIDAEIEMAKVSRREDEIWGGVSPHQPTRSLGKRRKFPSAGSWAEPQLKMDFIHI